MFSQIKDRKHIEQNFHSVVRVMPRVGTWGVLGGGKIFSVGICDGAPSTAHSSISITMTQASLIDFDIEHRLRKLFEPKNAVIFLPSNLTYVLGAQKNHLIGTVLLSTHNICFG